MGCGLQGRGFESNFLSRIFREYGTFGAEKFDPINWELKSGERGLALGRYSLSWFFSMRDFAQLSRASRGWFEG